MDQQEDCTGLVRFRCRILSYYWYGSIKFATDACINLPLYTCARTFCLHNPRNIFVRLNTKATLDRQRALVCVLACPVTAKRILCTQMFALDLSVGSSRGKSTTEAAVEGSGESSPKSITKDVPSPRPPTLLPPLQPTLPLRPPALSLLNYYNSWILKALAIDCGIHHIEGSGVRDTCHSAIDLAAKPKAIESTFQRGTFQEPLNIFQGTKIESLGGNSQTQWTLLF
ncbi:unnamed protein product [Mesocestoides corti]|uniref:Uncharacterized protein n=2 Tax=Mesocestoides corti TaxID=53468 RepID=A0A0R3U7X1_MESCO|nr:unnamed protein product [Mesocestoides corti]